MPATRFAADALAGAEVSLSARFISWGGEPGTVTWRHAVVPSGQAAWAASPSISRCYAWSRACIPPARHAHAPATRRRRRPARGWLRHHPWIPRPGVARRRDASGGPDPGSVAGRARAALAAGHQHVELQDWLRRRAHRQGERVEHAGHDVAVSALQPLRHRGRARRAGRRAHRHDRARARTSFPAARAAEGATDRAVNRSLAGDPAPGARGGSLRGRPPEAAAAGAARGVRGNGTLPATRRRRLVRRGHVAAHGGRRERAGGVGRRRLLVGRRESAPARDARLARSLTEDPASRLNAPAPGGILLPTAD